MSQPSYPGDNQKLSYCYKPIFVMYCFTCSITLSFVFSCRPITVLEVSFHHFYNEDIPIPDRLNFLNCRLCPGMVFLKSSPCFVRSGCSKYFLQPMKSLPIIINLLNSNLLPINVISYCFILVSVHLLFSTKCYLFYYLFLFFFTADKSSNLNLKLVMTNHFLSQPL